MLRLFLVIVLLAAGAVWIAPRWSPAERTLHLRVREPAEIASALRWGVRELGEEIVRRSSRDGEPRQPVGAGRPEKASPSEKLTPEDRARLDALVEEKLRED